jgi:hypothetical protein
MKQINPTRPYHPRSPDYEAEIGGKNEIGDWWGRFRWKTGRTDWEHTLWLPNGEHWHKAIRKNWLDLIQEPEVEEIVWKNLESLSGYRIFNETREHVGKCFPGLITLTITIQDDKVKVEGGTV